jgi:hypothetical protein
MAYAAVADVKAYLGIGSSTRTDDALLTALLERAQAAVDSHCRRTFEAAADSVRHYDVRALGGRVLYLDGDLCTITTVVNGDGATVASSNYTTEPRHATPYHALVLRPNSDAAWDVTADIAITGKWAYSASAPADVVQATVRLCAWMYRQKDNTGNDQPLIAGNVTILPARMPSDVEQMLDAYVRRYV